MQIELKTPAKRHRCLTYTLKSVDEGNVLSEEVTPSLVRLKNYQTQELFSGKKDARNWAQSLEKMFQFRVFLGVVAVVVLSTLLTTEVIQVLILTHTLNFVYNQSWRVSLVSPLLLLRAYPRLEKGNISVADQVSRLNGRAYKWFASCH